MVITQLELWNSKEFINRYLSEVKTAIASFNEDNWFLTSPSISEGKNYLFTTSTEVKELLGKILKIKFKGDLAVTDKLYLRKEILKKLQEV